MTLHFINSGASSLAHQEMTIAPLLAVPPSWYYFPTVSGECTCCSQPLSSQIITVFGYIWFTEYLSQPRRIRCTSLFLPVNTKEERSRLPCH